MRNVRRYDPEGAPVFLTLVCKDHAPHLADDRRKHLLLTLIREMHHDGRWKVHAWVILDDHLHLLVGECADFSGAVRDFKRQTLLRLRVRSIWQPRFFDHIIRDEGDLRAHLDYIHFNPRKHGLADQPATYPWSSLPTMVARGRYAGDWGSKEKPESITDDTGSE